MRKKMQQSSKRQQQHWCLACLFSVEQRRPPLLPCLTETQEPLHKDSDTPSAS